MKYVNYKELLFILVILFACTSPVKSACAVNESSTTCGRDDLEICYGADSGITAEDVICILKYENDCNMTARQDSCNECDLNPAQYQFGSQYMDCAGDCYPDDPGSMLVLDECDVCGGNNDTCGPKVTHLDLELIPSTNSFDFNINGTSFLTTDIQILRIRVNIGQFSKTKKVRGTLEKVTTHTGEMMTIRTGTIFPGEYEIGARTGDTGKEYEDHDGPMLTVYNENDFDVTSILPNEQDVDGTTDVNVTLQLSPSTGNDIKDLYDVTEEFTCFVRDTMNIDVVDDAETPIVSTYAEDENTVTCVLPIPEEPTRNYVCVSFNGRHIINCQSMTYFEVAPALEEDLIRFDASGSGLFLIFDKKLDVNGDLLCTSYFVDVTSLGVGPECLLSGDRLRLSVNLGQAASIELGETLVLKAGLKTNGVYVRETDAITVTVAPNADGGGGGDGGDDGVIVINPRNMWKTLFTNLADPEVTFDITIVESPGSRGAKEITWTLNDIIIEAATDQLEMVIPVPEAEGMHTVVVTAVDYMGGQASITHIFQKLDLDLPDVTFSPLGGTVLPDGNFQIFPNAEFVINLRVTLNTIGSIGGIDDYVWTWRKDKEDLNNAQMHYLSTKEQTTIDMCDQKVNYSLVVAPKTNVAEQLSYDMTCVVKCREPVSRISGGKSVNIDIAYGITELFGASSYDMDGGVLEYFWYCQTVGNLDCLQDIANPIKNSSTDSTVSLSSERMKAGKSYQLKLEVKVNKSGEYYKSYDMMNFHAKSGDTPVIRMVTIRNKFRRDTPIMVKAHISGEIKKVKWRFVDGLAEYDWLDADNTTVGNTTTIEEYSWYTINRDVLSSGRQYQLEIEVKSQSDVLAKELHDVNVYRVLKGCEVEARDMVEMQESYITLRNCIHDVEYGWVSIHCTAHGTKLHLKPSLTFITPTLHTNKRKVKLQCTVVDGLGYQMNIQSNEVTVTKATDEQREQKLQEFIDDDNYVEALDILADIPMTGDVDIDSTRNMEAVGLFESVYLNEPNPEDLRRALLGYSRLEVELIKGKHELKVLMRVVKSILSQMCTFTEDTTEDYLTDDDIAAILETTGKLVSANLAYRVDYRTISNKLGCTRLKRMRNEDYSTVTVNNNTKTVYAVNSLDDINDFGFGMEFPEELKAKYRDTWKCGESTICHGIGLVAAKHKTEPPQLAFNRADKECGQYVSLDLFNQVSGKRIDVKELEEVINMEFDGTNCPRAECWYFNTMLERFRQDGVYTNVKEDGTLQCQSKHLTSFTIRSGPKTYEGRNVPYIISVCVGTVLLVVSVIVLIKAFCATKRRHNLVDDVKEPLPPAEVGVSPPPSYQFSVQNTDMKNHYQ